MFRHCFISYVINIIISSLLQPSLREVIVVEICFFVYPYFNTSIYFQKDRYKEIYIHFVTCNEPL